MAEKNTNETKEKKIMSADITEMLTKAFGNQISATDKVSMVYLTEVMGCTIDKAKELLPVVKLADSFDTLNVLVGFYNYLVNNNFDKEYFMDLVRTGYYGAYKARSKEVIEEMKAALRADLGMDYVRQCVDRFKDDEECIIKAFKIVRKVIRDNGYEAGNIKRLLLLTHDEKTMNAVMRLYQRAAMVEEIESILVHYRFNAAGQYSALKKEITKRRILGTVRDEFMFL